MFDGAAVDGSGQTPVPDTTNPKPDPLTNAGRTTNGPPLHVLGVDYGTSITGLALGRNGWCSPLKSIPSLRTSKLSDVARQVLATALEQRVEGMVVGIPVQPGGSIVKPHTDSRLGSRCRNLAHTLALMAKEHGIPVYLYNEKDTTRATMKTLGYNWTDRLSGQEKQACKLDSESAAMLLRLYFGNPRLAVRVNAQVNIKRSPGTHNSAETTSDRE
ncbi:hypothetical protein VOLCADRAFT_106688 [Volvox carteri f. nagariensis]|uniref:YqgF/RNase H-like domain-containing protein n=1 Tax=Volvox carteri f. nagariensis TaxID=3068 RepID=D8U938_VOLCA|nr:uncharacterized protein VOLCADRAFT_106688 [Volvox carteri f. nagariensis]EFJ43682.1 hypothetical protein VOLCADRAFT_106688 [Volvox carteri f. nagariensis]|eukprot:XP_002955163.1 hypothetical protein VOLCADRAFT_106688 [Volvox carteri f. nagariensis]